MDYNKLLNNINAITSREDEPERETPRPATFERPHFESRSTMPERAHMPPRPVMATPRPMPTVTRTEKSKTTATVAAKPTTTTPTAEKPSMFSRMGGKRRHGKISHAKAVAAGRKGGKKAARNAAKRSRTAKKAAKTRVRKAEKRSRIARKAARARHGKR